MRLLITLNYLITVVLSYLIMLMVMNYNAGVFLCAVFGLTFGFFVFGLMKLRLKAKRAADQQKQKSI